MKKKKAWIFLVITLLVLLYVFVEAPTLSPLYLDGAIFWAVLITIYVGLNALMKIGEFSFVLARSGVDAGLLDNLGYQVFLASSILTMVATPFMMGAAPAAAGKICVAFSAGADRAGKRSRRRKAPAEPRGTCGIIS